MFMLTLFMLYVCPTSNNIKITFRPSIVVLKQFTIENFQGAFAQSQFRTFLFKNKNTLSLPRNDI